MNDVQAVDVHMMTRLAQVLEPGEARAQTTLGSSLDLYREHFSFLWRTVGQMGVDPTAIADAVHHVFVVVHRRRADFEGRSSVRTWLFSIARRVVADYRKADRRRRATPTEPAALDFLAGDDHALDKLEASNLVSALLDTLDDAKRRRIELPPERQNPRTRLQKTVRPPGRSHGIDRLAERKGFEPPVPFSTPDFQSGTFDHSVTSPEAGPANELVTRFST